MIRQFMRRLDSLETAAKPAPESSWAMENLSHEEVAAKLKQYREGFSDPEQSNFVQLAREAGVTTNFNDMGYINDRE